MDRQYQMAKQSCSGGLRQVERPSHQIEIEQNTVVKALCDQLCSFCGQKFRTKTDVVQHQFQLHDLKHFDCDVCGQMFRKRQNMETHRRIHTGEKPYRCNLCHDAFRAMSGLTYHMNKKHYGQY